MCAHHPACLHGPPPPPFCSPNVLVTNHEAQAFPLLRNLLPESKEQEKHFLFDRILCDVPCSGLRLASCWRCCRVHAHLLQHVLLWGRAQLHACTSLALPMHLTSTGR